MKTHSSEIREEVGSRIAGDAISAIYRHLAGELRLKQIENFRSHFHQFGDSVLYGDTRHKKTKLCFSASLGTSVAKQLR